jgi:hypothetical protein
VEIKSNPTLPKNKKCFDGLKSENILFYKKSIHNTSPPSPISTKIILWNTYARPMDIMYHHGRINMTPNLYREQGCQWRGCGLWVVGLVG